MGSLGIGALVTGFGLLWLVFTVIVAVVLLQLYQRTRATGFIWLMIATSLFPIVVRGLTFAAPLIIASRAYPVDTAAIFTACIFGAASLIEVILMLVAVLQLRTWAAGQTFVHTSVAREQDSPFYARR